MKRRQLVIGATGLIIGGVIALQAHNFYYNMRTSATYTITMDSIFSSEHAQKIKTFINQTLPNKLPEEIATTLQCQFPSIKNIRIRRRLPGSLDIHVQAVEPQWIINNKLLISNGGTIPLADITSAIKTKLPVIKLINEQTMPLLAPQIAQFVEQLPSDLYINYQLIVQGNHHVFLKARAIPLIILCEIKCVPSADILQHCEQLAVEKQDELIKRAKPNAKAGCMLADIRFDKQIIVSFIKGEIGDGKSIF